jgi:hypothetical protein
MRRPRIGGLVEHAPRSASTFWVLVTADLQLRRVAARRAAPSAEGLGLCLLELRLSDHSTLAKIGEAGKFVGCA